jgi:hypothetical protein
MLAVFCGGLRNALLFLRKASSLELSPDLWWKILGFVNGVLIVACASSRFGAGDGC